MLNNKYIELVQVFNRNIEKIEYLNNQVEITDKNSELKDADIYIISIADKAIPKISSKLNFPNKLVVHTSGTSDINELKSTSNKGVFYPLQTFSKDKNIDFSQIPICIEAENNEDLILLENLANSISGNCYKLNSIQRRNLHVSAVFVNNFVNHLYHLGSEICNKNDIPFEILLPLIKETAQKVEKLLPLEAQTGPARRNDFETIEKHLSILQDNNLELYKALTSSITNTYGKEL